MSSLFFRIFHCSPKQAATAVVLGFLIAIVIGSFLAWQKSSAPANTFRDWQPITNKTWSYTLKLPASFSLINKSDAADLLRYRMDATVFEVFALPAKSLNTYLTALDAERSTGFEGQPSVTIVEKRRTSVDGRPAQERELLLNAAGFPAMETIVVRNGTAYLFTSLFEDATQITAEGRQLHRDSVSTISFGT